MNFKQSIANALAEILGNEVSFQEILEWIEVPRDSLHGDYCFPCHKLSKTLQKSPIEIAQIISKQLEFDSNVIEKIEVAGPFINFFVNKSVLTKKTLTEILEKEDLFGSNNIGKGKKIVIEFSSPNTNKPLHIGHVRNNSIGDAIANICKALSFEVIKYSIINDRGIHICKSMLAYKKWGLNRNPKEEGIKSDHFVGQFYVLFNKKLQEDSSLELEAQNLLKKWEQGDSETIALWNKMNSWVYQGFEKTYLDFKVSFDEFFYESQIYKQGKELIDEGLSKGVFLEKDGAIIAPLKKFNLPDKVLIRSDGTSIYVTQDIYLAKLKFDKYGFDQAIYVVGSEQNLYFKQLFSVLELLGFEWSKKLHHLSYGMVYLPKGKMKSREGTVVDADNLLNELISLAVEELKKRYSLSNEELLQKKKELEKRFNVNELKSETAKEKIKKELSLKVEELKEFGLLGRKEFEKRAKAIALAAIKFYMLKIDAVKDIHFNPKESVSFEGETGPYIQYSFARAKSILNKSEINEKSLMKANFSLLKNEKELELINLLSTYPEVIKDSFNSLSLHKLCHYLIELSSLFNSFYQSVSVLNADSESLRNARLALVKAVSIELKNGLSILGIDVLEEM